MEESLCKYVVPLRAEDSPEYIDSLLASGMRVALLDGRYPPQTLEQLRGHVLASFARQNTPVGLMLRLTPGCEAQDMEPYQYILLSGYDSGRAGVLKQAAGTAAQWIVEEPEELEPWLEIAGGILTGREELAREAACAGKMVLTGKPSLSPRDGLLWSPGVCPEELAALEDDREWPWEIIDRQLALAGRDPGRVTACLAARYAGAVGAKALLVMTHDGGNLPWLSSLYLPIPIIAIARRPAGEAMLLRQTMRYGTLPTAIGKVPEDPKEKMSFARWVAQLYGFAPGDRFVVTGHWQAGEPSDYMEYFEL